jgi:hypothetical protein
MEQETESTQDYYILFRDANDLTPIDCGARCPQQDHLTGDKASYVWCYVGTLDDNQAMEVQARLDLEFGERFQKERKPSAINLGELPEVELNDINKIGFIQYSPHKKQARREIINRHRSFVEIFSLETLSGMWKRFGYCVPHELLRHTARIWVITALENGKVNPSKCHDVEHLKKVFKLRVNCKGYFSTLTPRQLEVLGKCVGIVKSVRAEDGCRDTFENKYEAKWVKFKTQREGLDSLKRRLEKMNVGLEKMNVGLEEMNVRLEKIRVKHEKIRVKYEKKGVAYEKKRVAYEQTKIAYMTMLGTNVDDFPSYPPLMPMADQGVTSVINENFSAPIAEPAKLPVVPETVAEQDRQASSHVSYVGIDSTPHLLKENVAASEPVNQTDEQPATQKRDRTGGRGDRIKNAAYEYYSGLLKGETVKKEEIAKQHGFEKETNVLSKADVMKKYGLDKIEEKIDEVERLFESIAKIDNKERTKLLTIVYNTLKR